jgi:ABC-type xylose transport system permease subunit
MSDTDVKQNRFMGALVQMRSLNVFVIFLLLFIVFTIFSPGNRFFSRDNMKIFLATGAEFNIMAIAVGMLMIAGEFDLSVGSILVFASWIFYLFYNSGIPVFPALILTLGGGGVYQRLYHRKGEDTLLHHHPGNHAFLARRDAHLVGGIAGRDGT